MPPRNSLSSRAARLVQKEVYVCPSCLFTQHAQSSLRRPNTRASPQEQTTRRSYTSIDQARRNTRPRAVRHSINGIPTKRYTTAGILASTTAINAPTSVPSHLRALHQHLTLLSDKASNYTDLSRLQLAVRSLQSSDPVLRIAFLGLGSSGLKAARKLARVLLADVLSDEEVWERELLREDRAAYIDDGRSVLLRYGETMEDRGVQSSTSGPMSEMSIPSPFLRKHNVEILVTGVHAQGGVAEQSIRELEESLLVPPLTIPGQGRVGFVRYPVHAALVVAEGVKGALELGRLSEGLPDGKMIDIAVNLVGKSSGLEKSESDEKLIDVRLAAHSLDLFRTNSANGAAFSSEWQASRVNNVSSWIGECSGSREALGELKPAIRNLLASIFARTTAAINMAESFAVRQSTAFTVPDQKRAALQSAITSWSEDAHHDLQTNLSSVFLSPAWKRTVWWRLFYRIDEVSISASDVLRRGWLVEAEQTLAFLSGRILESGLANQAELKGISVAAADEGRPVDVKPLLDNEQKQSLDEFIDTEKGKKEQSRYGTVAELLQLPPLLSKIREQSGLNALFDPPWPQTIQLARQQMLHQIVPELHARAQRLMLASLSTIGGSCALGAWLWLATGGLYEGGAVAALGLTWALRKLQKQWGFEREEFAVAAREDARRVLVDVEARLKELVSQGGRTTVREEDRREWDEVRAAVKHAEDLLQGVAEKKD